MRSFLHDLWWYLFPILVGSVALICLVVFVDSCETDYESSPQPADRIPHYQGRFEQRLRSLSQYPDTIEGRVGRRRMARLIEVQYRGFVEALESGGNVTEGDREVIDETIRVIESEVRQ